jgi:hypothetical protein
MSDSYNTWLDARRNRRVRVYVAICDECIKICVAADVAAHAASLREGNPHEISVGYVSPPMKRENATGLQKLARSRLAKYRAAGNWFVRTPADGERAITGAAE